MATHTITQVYEAAAKLADAKDNPISELPSYQFLLEAKEGDIGVKTLAAQNIPRFFHLFPSLSEKALNAQLDLCEDDELQIRLHAIRGLAQLCQESPTHVRRMACVLCQLLTTAKIELQVVKQAFRLLFNIDSKACYSAIFEQIADTQDDLRANNIEYFFGQVDIKGGRSLQEMEKDAELQTVIVEGTKKLVLDNLVNLNQLALCLRLLSRLPAVKNDPTFVPTMSKVFSTRAHLDAEFQPADSEAIKNYCQCLAMGVKTLKLANMGDFVVHFATKILPVLDSVGEADRTGILKQIIKCSSAFSSELAHQVFPQYFEFFKEHLLLDEKAGAEELFQLECYTILFHNIAAKSRSTVKNTCGLFLKSGQPTDYVTEDIGAVKDDLVERFKASMAMLAKLKAIKKKETEVALKVDAKEKEDKKQKGNAINLATQVEESIHTFNSCLRH